MLGHVRAFVAASVVHGLANRLPIAREGHVGELSIAFDALGSVEVLRGAVEIFIEQFGVASLIDADDHVARGGNTLAGLRNRNACCTRTL